MEAVPVTETALFFGLFLPVFGAADSLYSSKQSAFSFQLEGNTRAVGAACDPRIS